MAALSVNGLKAPSIALTGCMILLTMTWKLELFHRIFKGELLVDILINISILTIRNVVDLDTPGLSSKNTRPWCKEHVLAREFVVTEVTSKVTTHKQLAKTIVVRTTHCVPGSRL